MKKTILGLLLGSACFSSYADTIECVELVKNNTIEIELKKNESFENCFSLEGVAANTTVDFVIYSDDNVRNKITLYDLNKSGSESYISDQYSSTDSSNVFSLNNTNRKIGFEIKPTTKLDSNKNITVTHMIVSGTAQVLIELDNLPAPRAPRPPFDDGGFCEYRGGARICYDAK